MAGASAPWTSAHECWLKKDVLFQDVEGRYKEAVLLLRDAFAAITPGAFGAGMERRRRGTRLGMAPALSMAQGNAWKGSRAAIIGMAAKKTGIRKKQA